MKKTEKFAALVISLALLLTGCGQTAAPRAVTSEETTGTQIEDPVQTASAAAASAETEEAAGAHEIPEIDMSVAWDQEFTASTFAMDVLMHMKAYGPGAQEALSVITSELSALQSQFSVTSEGSEIYAINHAGGKAVTVSDTTLKLLEQAVALGDTTGGALDISIYPVLTAWGFTTDNYQIPSDSEISELLSYVDDNQIVFDEENDTVTVPENMEVDLGSVVKGYAGDQAVEVLEACGVTSALLNFGGSTIRVVGSKPDGSAWKVAVQDPNDSGSYAGILRVSDCAVDTSGGYERYFEDTAGNVYWHILDPETGYPARSGLLSATIISTNSFTGDGLSTASFVMGLEKTIDYWRANGGFEFVLITDDGEIYASEGIADSFTPCGSYEGQEVHVVLFTDDSE